MRQAGIGVCRKCGKPVNATQGRVMDDRGIVHKKCPA
jgi:hypothetical protein